MIRFDTLAVLFGFSLIVFGLVESIWGVKSRKNRFTFGLQQLYFIIFSENKNLSKFGRVWICLVRFLLMSMLFRIVIYVVFKV